MSGGTSAGPHGAGPAGVPGSPRGASDAARPLGNQGRACRRQRRNRPVPLPAGRRKLCSLRWKPAAQRRSSRPALLPVDPGKSMTAPLPEPACRAKAFSPVWPVRRDSKSGARRRSPKEDSPSCRKSTDGIKTKSGSTRGAAGCETVFSRGMHKKPLQRTAFVPRPAWKAICAGKACEHRFDNVESLWKGRDASRADSFGERDFAEESPLSRCL